MTHEQAVNYAVERFDAGLNCAEAVLAAAAKYAGVDSALIPRAATPFGAGIGRAQGVCGLATGGAMAIGILFGRDDETGDREKPYALVKRYLAAIERAKGTTSCRDITGIDMSNPAEAASYRQPGGVHFTVCGPLMRSALAELLTLFDENKEAI